MFFIVHVKSSLVSGRSFPTEYVVLSLSKLQISDYSTKKRIPLMDIWNNSGPNIEPCVIPWQISDHLLYEEPTLVLYFVESKRKLRLPSSNPYDSNFAINKSCDKQKIKKEISLSTVTPQGRLNMGNIHLTLSKPSAIISKIHADSCFIKLKTRQKE